MRQQIKDLEKRKNILNNKTEHLLITEMVAAILMRIYSSYTTSRGINLFILVLCSMNEI